MLISNAICLQILELVRLREIYKHSVEEINAWHFSKNRLTTVVMKKSRARTFLLSSDTCGKSYFKYIINDVICWKVHSTANDSF